MTRILNKTAAVLLMGALSLFGGESYVTLYGGGISGDLDGTGRYGIGIESLSRNVFGDGGTVCWQLGMAYSGGDSKYFDMDASFRPGYEVAKGLVIGAILGVNGGSLSDSIGVYGFDVGATLRYNVTEDMAVGIDYKHGIEKTDGDLDLNINTVYFTLGFHF